MRRRGATAVAAYAGFCCFFLFFGDKRQQKCSSIHTYRERALSAYKIAVNKSSNKNNNNKKKPWGHYSLGLGGARCCCCCRALTSLSLSVPSPLPSLLLLQPSLGGCCAHSHKYKRKLGRQRSCCCMCVCVCLSKQCNKIQLFSCASCTLFRLLLRAFREQRRHKMPKGGKYRRQRHWKCKCREQNGNASASGGEKG